MPENPYASPVAEDSAEGDSPDYMMAGRLASRGARLVAVLIDGVVLLLIAVPFQYVLKFGYFDQSPPTAEDVNPINPLSVYAHMTWMEILYSVATPILIYLVVNGALLKHYGQTIGKRAMGIKIVRKDGGPAEFHRLIVHRYLALTAIYLIPVVGFLFLLLDPLMIFRRSRYCLHDDIADTVVIVA